MALTVRIPTLRSLGLIFAGVLLGALLVAPVLARDTTTSASVQPALTQTRSISCHGLNFHPIEVETGYGYSDVGGLYLNREHGFTGGFPYYDGDGNFLCDPHLPDRAVITKVQWTLYDLQDGSEVRDCALYRSSIGGTATASENMSLIPTTGNAATPGKVRYSDITIEHATVNNAKYVYYLQCQLTGGSTVGIYRATVTYTISA